MRILIIEDEVKTAAYIRKGLEEHGFAVDHSSHGEEGLQLALINDYDLIVLDVMLPGRDGWSVLSEIRNARLKTLVLFLSARDALDERVKGLNLGADAYLSKPFAFSELIAMIRTLLRRGPQQQAQDLLQVGDLAINVRTRLVARAGVKLNLTQKEFALLHLLAQHAGEIITRTTILEKIWNIHFESESNSVEVHIRRLRAKVDDPWPRKLIKTVRGVGYTIEDMP